MGRCQVRDQARSPNSSGAFVSFLDLFFSPPPLPPGHTATWGHGLPQWGWLQSPDPPIPCATTSKVYLCHHSKNILCVSAEEETQPSVSEHSLCMWIPQKLVKGRF